MLDTSAKNVSSKNGEMCTLNLADDYMGVLHYSLYFSTSLSVS